MQVCKPSLMSHLGKSNVRNLHLNLHNPQESDGSCAWRYLLSLLVCVANFHLTNKSKGFLLSHRLDISVHKISLMVRETQHLFEFASLLKVSCINRPGVKQL